MLMRVIALTVIAGIFYVLCAVPPAEAGKKEKAEKLVVAATEVVRDFADDNIHTGLSDYAGKAKAIVIIPASVRAGFVFGASGGNAAILAKDKSGEWSDPSFLRIGSVSFGLQAGGEVSEIILLVMTERGKEQLFSTSVKLGAGLSVAAGTNGVGAKLQTTDVLAYSKAKGLYGSISLEGAVLKVHHKWNKAYYGRAVTPLEIIGIKNVSNPQAYPLRNAVAVLAARGRS